MRILFDHCVPKRLRDSLPSHEVRTADQMGWSDLRNGNLLLVASKAFDVGMTVDRNLRYQQNPAELPIAVVVMVAKSNKRADLIPLIPDVEKALASIEPRTLVEVG